MSSESNHPDYVRRRALKVAVAALISEVGFTHTEEPVLETLTEMLQSCEWNLTFSAIQRYGLWTICLTACVPWTICPTFMDDMPYCHG